MNFIKKKITILLFLVFSIISFSNEDYQSFLLGDTKGTVYNEDNVYEVRPLASITKVMTLLITFDKIKENKISMDDMVTVSKTAAKVPYGVKLTAGKEYSVRDLVKATSIRSSNNAAYALAEYVGGDVDSFVYEMNRKAKSLGLDSVRYCTPHGLPPANTGGRCMDQGNAKDLYKLALTALEYPEYLEVSKVSSTYIDNGNIAVKSTNNLLNRVNGLDGLKTGYHSAAGSNIILTAERDNKRVVAVILGSKTSKNRDNFGEWEINNFYETHKNSVLVDSLKSVGYFKIKGNEFNLYPEKNIEVDFSFNPSALNYELILNKNIKETDVNKSVGKYKLNIEGKTYTGNLIMK